VVLVLAMVGLAVRFGGDDGPDHPDAWDPRVADIAAFVEQERGHDFDHPVYVDFLSPADYTKATTTESAGLTDEDREELEQYAGELRAFGVGSGKIDLFTAYNTVADSGTLAYYDPDTERVTVRGTTMTPGLEVTLAHELTHALQDQTFDLDAVDDETDPVAATAFRALAEGDAMRVEDAYTDQELSEKEQSDYDAEYQDEVDESQAATGDVPDYVTATFQAPYALGRPFVALLANAGGNERIDAAFAHPPITGEHLFDPASFLDDEGQEEVDLGVDDEDVIEAGHLSPMNWFLILGERIDPKQAFHAALGWNGDAYAAYDDDGTVCVRAAFVGDTDEDEDEMADAIDDWVDAMPGGEAEAKEIDGHPGLQACDPGTDVDMKVTDGSTTALFLPSLWGFLEADAASGLTTTQSRCYADRVIGGLTYAQITDPDGKAFQTDGFQDQLQAAVLACT
jgi:hypothetical protein